MLVMQHIERLLKPMHVLTSEAQEEENDAAGSVRWAVRLSLYANFALAGLQVRSRSTPSVRIDQRFFST